MTVRLWRFPWAAAMLELQLLLLLPGPPIHAGCVTKTAPACYDDANGNRLLGPKAAAAPLMNMSLVICAQMCTDENHTLAGVEYGQQCYCGDKLNYSPVASTRCTTQCRGNASEMCGGTSAIAVYEFSCSGLPVPIPSPPTPPAPAPAPHSKCPGRSQCQCPCSPSSLCRSLPLGAARDSNATVKRVFAFHEGQAIYNGSADEWGMYDWDAVTTVVTGTVVGGDDVNNWNQGTWCVDHYCHNISQDLLCQAHERGVRVVGFTYWPWNTSPESWGQLANATKRRLWVEGAVATAVRLGLDGYNVDIEGQMNASLRSSLTSLTCELKAALTAAIPGASVSFDLAVDPGAYPPIMLGYDYAGLARCLDTLSPMAYDSESKPPILCIMLLQPTNINLCITL
jgi:hypothetical protein